MMPRRLAHAIVVAVLLIVAGAELVDANHETGCRPEPVGPNTPTGVAGCEPHWGRGVASHYGPGNGVAMNFCTWELRHSEGCGWVRVTSLDTGLSVVAPVVDFGDLYTNSADERLIDLQYGVVADLGLPLERGLYGVEVQPVTHGEPPAPSTALAAPQPNLPDTSISTEDRVLMILAFLGWMALFVAVVIGESGSEPLFRRRRRK